MRVLSMVDLVRESVRSTKASHYDFPTEFTLKTKVTLSLLNKTSNIIFIYQ